MKNLLVVVDVATINRALMKTQPNTRLDYRAFLSSVKGDDILLRALAYGYNTQADSDKFRTCLQRYGYQLFFRDVIKSTKEPGKKIFIPYQVKLTADVMTIVGNGKIDKVILATNDPAYVDLILTLKNKGIEVEVICPALPMPIIAAASSTKNFDQSVITQGVKIDGAEA